MKFLKHPRRSTAFSRFFRGFTALTVLIPLLFLSQSACSCAPRSAGAELFFFRSEDLSATLSVECNGYSSTMEFTRVGEREDIYITSPEQLSGLRFTNENGKITVSLGEFSTDAPTALTLLPTVCSAVFSPSPELVYSIETVETNGETLTKTSLDGLTLTLDRNGLPVSAEGTVNGVTFRADITKISSESVGEPR